MVLLALSIQGQVEKYGSYVGIAAFFGLAILSLLYFAQAREVKRLREWAGRAPERAREVEEAALAAADAARRRPPPVAVPQAAPQPVAAATAAGGRSGTVSPAVPVGAGGTAVAEQERPEGEASEDGEGEPPVVEGPVTEDGKRPVAAVEPAATDADAADPEAAERDDEDVRDEAEDADADEGAEEQPAPAAASPSNGSPPAGAERPAFPRPSTAAGVASAGGAAASQQPPAATPAPSRPAPAMPLRAGTTSASPRRAVTQPPRRPAPPAAPASSGRGGKRWAIAGGVAAVVVALGVFAATQLLHKDASTKPNTAATPTASATAGATASGSGKAPTSRADTTVAVFNGTTINGLAASTADKLVSSGYKRGSTGDFTDQQRSASTIFYRRDARREARDIGRELHISDLRSMDAETQALAGDRASVAVVVGSDKAP
jgi:LytR cell envelope-related transcriptional attenuator